jgi:hypothetical protein
VPRFSAAFISPPMIFASLPSSRALALAALLSCLAPRVRAENSVSYKYEDYREMGGRIAVETQGAHVQKSFGTDTQFKLEGVLDAIAGATPNGQPAPAGSDQVPLTRITERRKAWNANLAHQFRRTNVAVGVANSRESDYVSTGWSLNTLTDFNQKNTTLLAGVAHTDDEIRVFYQVARAEKRTNDFILGVTQLVSPQAFVTLNLTYGLHRGYLADPYKLVQKNTEIVPGVSLPLTFAENRPNEREKWIVLLGYNRAFGEARAALDATYRFYHDSYGSDTHTIDIAWFQRLSDTLILRPSFRYYDQSAADFYFYRLDGTSVVPVAGPPRPNGPFYSSDYRLSALRTFTHGMKVIWNPTESLQLDLAFERYDMRGKDGVTPQSAYCRANIITAGAKFSW